MSFEYNRDITDAIHALEEDIWTYGDGDLYNDYCLEDFEWHYGVSKVVIMCDDVVVKTAFAGMVESDYNEETEDYEERFIPNEDDECAVEYEVYKKAVEYGLEKFFAKIEPTEVAGVYIQEKCDVTLSDLYDLEEFDDEYSGLIKGHDLYKNSDYEELKALGENNGLSELFFRTRNSQTSTYLFDNYSLEDLLKLQSFLVEFDINDIHGSNAGLFGDKIKIFDFCGYESNTGSLVSYKED